MTTVIRNRRRSERRAELARAIPSKEEEDESQPTNVSVPRETGERRGLRAETKLVWALPCKKEEDEVNVLVVTPGNGIVVHLNEVEEARKVLDIVKLSNIVFQENGVAVEGKIR